MKHGKFLILTELAILAEVGDEIAKYIFLNILPDEGSLVDTGFLALAIHRNYGMIFDIPFKLSIIMAISVVVGIFLAIFLIDNWKKAPKVSFFTALILIGAAGNLFDRLVYGFTIDYLLIGGRLAINFSDLVIVLGVAGILFTSNRNTRNEKFDKS